MFLTSQGEQDYHIVNTMAISHIAPSSSRNFHLQTLPMRRTILNRNWIAWWHYDTNLRERLSLLNNYDTKMGCHSLSMNWSIDPSCSTPNNHQQLLLWLHGKADRVGVIITLTGAQKRSWLQQRQNFIQYHKHIKNNYIWIPQQIKHLPFFSTFFFSSHHITNLILHYPLPFLFHSQLPTCVWVSMHHFSCFYILYC